MGIDFPNNGGGGGLPGDFLVLPAGDFAGSCAEVRADEENPLGQEQERFEIFPLLDLRQGGLVVVQFELEEIDVLVRFNKGVNPSVAVFGFGMDFESEQSEDDIEDVLEIRLTLVMDIVGDSGKEDFQRLLEFFKDAPYPEN